MSAWLLVLIPLALLAIVSLLGFVGCTNDWRGFEVAPSPPVIDYSGETILPDPRLVAYWPLGEPKDATKAIDLKSGYNGDYLHQEIPAEPQGAYADGTLALGSPGIVPGDTVAPHDATSPTTTCMFTNGGYVSVPFEPALNPTKNEGFTLEAWVSAEWDPQATPVFRVVIASLESVGGFKGFQLLATPDNRWAASIGNGTDMTTHSTAQGTLMVETTYHLVATYDGSDLTLYVNGVPAPPTPADYHPAAANPLYIGANRPDLPEPHHPFSGSIQCVAVYKGVLDPGEILKHYQSGIHFGP